MKKQDGTYADYTGTRLKPFLEGATDSSTVQDIEKSAKLNVIKEIKLTPGSNDVLKKRLEAMHKKYLDAFPNDPMANIKLDSTEGLIPGMRIRQNQTNPIIKPGFQPNDSSLIYYPNFKPSVSVDGNPGFKIDSAGDLNIRQAQYEGQIVSGSTGLVNQLNEAYKEVTSLAGIPTTPRKVYGALGRLFWMLVHTQPYLENSEEIFFKVLADAIGKDPETVVRILGQFKPKYDISLEHLALTMGKDAFSSNFYDLITHRLADVVNLGL